jgi:heme oxygenase
VKALPVELKTRTRALHAALDASLPLVDPSLTRAQYSAFLVRMLAWLRPTERLVAERLSVARWPLEPRPRAPHLETDLASLGLASPNDAPAAMVPALHCEAHAIGSVYVLEGSALGGQVISRHLTSTLGITATSGGRYFTGDGALTARRWRDVCTALEHYGSSDVATVSEGANRTFSSLLVWLDDQPSR